MFREYVIFLGEGNHWSSIYNLTKLTCFFLFLWIVSFEVWLRVAEWSSLQQEC